VAVVDRHVWLAGDKVLVRPGAQPRGVPPGTRVDELESAVRAVTVVTQVGSVLPLLTSSTGLVFTAYLPERETADLVAAERLQEGVEDPAALLQEIRTRGLHHVHGLLLPGVDALSAPVFDATGRLAAVLTVVGPTSMFHADAHGPAAERLLAASRTVSWRMGHES
uniref:IclR family transcriptional regulator domain-containing protein n=1 Tax=Pseudomonas sp. TaxID=306 RepID=UPI00258AF78A